MKMWLVFSLPFFILALIFSFKDKSLSLGFFCYLESGLVPSSVFTCINQVAHGEPNKGARRKFSGIPPFCRASGRLKRGRLPGKFRQRNASGHAPLEGSQGRVTFARKIPKRDMPCIPSDKKSRGTGCAERGRALVRPFRLRRCGLGGRGVEGGWNLLH